MHIQVLLQFALKIPPAGPVRFAATRLAYTHRWWFFLFRGVKLATIQPLIKQYVRRGTTVYTDQWWGYQYLRDAGFDHRTVRHGAGEYAAQGAHTNAIENFWAHLKLSIRGTHIHVSSQHLQKYVTEFAFRYNYRNMPDRMFAVLLASLVSPV